MAAKNKHQGYSVTLRYTPGSGFVVAVGTDSGEHQQSLAQLATLEHAFRLAHKTLAAAGFTVKEES